MTEREYQSAKKRNNSATASTVRDNLIKVRRMYAKVLKRMNRVVARLPQAELSSRNRERILASVPREKLFTEITGYIDTGRKKVIKRTFDIDRKYVEDAFKAIGVTKDLSEAFDRQAGKIDRRYAVKNATVNYSLLVQNRARYSLSPSVWDAIDGFSDKILAIVEAELKAGTDPVKITKILEEYLSGGSEKILGRWLQLDIGSPEYKKRIGKGGADYRTQRVVRTEMYNARRDADIEAGRMNPGATGMFNWTLSPVSNSCEICEGRASSGPYDAETIQALQNDIHPNCHPAGTLITTIEGEKDISEIRIGDIVLSHDGTYNRVSSFHRSLIHNYLYDIETTEGKITATGDHPILTESGWTTANKLKNGNNLFRVYSGIINSSLVKTEPNNAPSNRLKERGFLHVLSLLSSTGMPSTAVNFNGKLFIYESKVNVILPNGKVRARANAKLLERIMQGKLIFTGTESRSSNGTLDEFFVGSFNTSDSIVCGGHIRLKPVSIFPCDSLAKVQLLESDSGKVSINTDSTNPEDFRYLVNREIFISEESCEPFGVNVDFCTHNSAIVHVSKRIVNDIVYNMSVENTNTYIANGFVSHNCACLVNPVLKDHDEFMAELQAYVGGEDNAIADWASIYGI